MRDDELSMWRSRCVSEIDRLIDEVRRLTAVNEHLVKNQQQSPAARAPAQLPERVRVSEREAAKMLGISSKTLYIRRTEGRLAFVQDGCRIFYEIEELKRYTRDNSKTVGKAE